MFLIPKTFLQKGKRTHPTQRERTRLLCETTAKHTSYYTRILPSGQCPFAREAAKLLGVPPAIETEREERLPVNDEPIVLVHIATGRNTFRRLLFCDDNR